MKLEALICRITVVWNKSGPISPLGQSAHQYHFNRATRAEVDKELKSQVSSQD